MSASICPLIIHPLSNQLMTAYALRKNQSINQSADDKAGRKKSCTSRDLSHPIEFIFVKLTINIAVLDYINVSMIFAPSFVFQSLFPYTVPDRIVEKYGNTPFPYCTECINISG